MPHPLLICEILWLEMPHRACPVRAWLGLSGSQHGGCRLGCVVAQASGAASIKMWEKMELLCHRRSGWLDPSPRGSTTSSERLSRLSLHTPVQPCHSAGPPYCAYCRQDDV